MKCEVKCYLTGGEDELVTGQVRLIAEDVWLFHLQLAGSPQKPQQVIVYCHSSNSLEVMGLVIKFGHTEKINISISRANKLLNLSRLRLVHIPKLFHVFTFDFRLFE